MSKYSSLDWIKWLEMDQAELLNHCRIDSFRGSGRGGQKRNKTSNAIRITLGAIFVTEGSSRSKSENITKAFKKIRFKIALDISEGFNNRPVWENLPSEMKPYFQKGLIRINPHNLYYPVFLGILLDLVIQFDGNLKQTAELLEISFSQLTKFLKKDSKMLETVNKVQQILKNNITDKNGTTKEI